MQEQANDQYEGDNAVCYYCKKNHAISEHYYSHKMYFIHKRTLWPGYRYSEKTIKIPRCKECDDKHHSFGSIFTCSLFVVTLAVYFWLFREQSKESFGFYLFVVFLLTGFTAFPIWYVYRLIFFTKRMGIPDEEDFDDFPLAKQLLDSGWIKSRPDPGSHPDTSDERVEQKLKEEQDE